VSFTWFQYINSPVSDLAPLERAGLYVIYATFGRSPYLRM
jgi:hypothetical protein